MPLTDTAIRSFRPTDKIQRIRDERGLYLEVRPNGNKFWRFRYWIDKKERILSLGPYPEISLREARERREETRKLLAGGKDPAEVKKAAREEAEAPAETFEPIAREWHARKSKTWVIEHAEKIIRRFELYIFPWVGAKPIREISAPDLLQCLRRIEDKGTIETAHRVHQICSQVFRYAIATGRAERDPTADLRGALTPVKGNHRAAITDPAGAGELMRAIGAYSGCFTTRVALAFGVLTFVRPGELRHAEWAEIDMERAEWRIPGPKMKMREQHIVPLAQQALELLEQLWPLTGSGKFLFPCVRSDARPMSEVTILAALRRLGYTQDQMTGHGFRAMASTLLNEAGWPPDVIERQLAHAERNKVRAAYNRASLLPERRRMMQAWADYLDALRDGKVEATCAP
ncbi:MAG: integrase arm-type DNA-binding domain-containing protein [Solidesulfovibrio sp.]|uniref:tyrosine-type recombinase/integrase n=1 Tax=Solidesulfovibrio sp. TaxID=2910990 RepID=UPI0031594B5B